MAQNFMRSALGDDVIDHYIHTAKWEQHEYDKRVIDLDLCAALSSIKFLKEKTLEK